MNFLKLELPPTMRYYKIAPLNENPISPDKLIIYSIFIGIGIFIALIIILLNYITHDKITALHEINKYSSIEISTLGMIPFIKIR